MKQTDVSWGMPGSFLVVSIAIMTGLSVSCGNSAKVQAKDPGGVDSTPTGVSVGVVQLGRMTLDRTLNISSELIPFQEIDVYAKEAGYVKELNVDYGSHVRAGQVMAVLDIPELAAELKLDDAAIRNATDQITYAQHELSRVRAQHHVYQLEYDRLNGVAKAKPGLVAQQEVDDAEGKALASEAQIDAAESNLESARSRLAEAVAKKEHDQALFDYAKVTAPFAGVVTQRYANLGTLMQAGTSSSTQVLPLVRLSEDDRFRLAIPVPESDVRFIHLGDVVQVSVPSLNKTFPGKIARFSVDVREDTRTMHTEVDVYNPERVLLPGVYADATLTLERKPNVLAVPVQALDRNGDQATVDVITADHKIDVRDVALGIQTPNNAEVLSGLKDGDQVVVSDRSSLKIGQPVQPKVVQLEGYQEPKDAN